MQLWERRQGIRDAVNIHLIISIYSAVAQVRVLELSISFRIDDLKAEITDKMSGDDEG